jgi:hypothetical protein
MTSKIHNIEDRISKRALAGLPTTVDVDSRSFEIIITTETPYERYIPDPRLGASKYEADWIKVSEVLPMAAMDFSRVARMPLVDNHAVGKGLDGGQIGRVDNVRIEGDKVIGTAILAHKYRDLIIDIKDGFFGQVSAGYEIVEAELIERPDDIPEYRALKWVLQEASLVPVAADVNAFVRSAKPIGPSVTVRSLTQPNTEKKSMEYEELVVAAEDATMAAAAAVTALNDASDEGASDEVKARAKALRKRADEETINQETENTEAKADDPEVEEVRALARSLKLEHIVTDGLKMKSPLTEIRSGLRKAYFAKAAAPAETVDVTPRKRSDEPATALNTVEIYQRENSRWAGAKRS